MDGRQSPPSYALCPKRPHLHPHGHTYHHASDGNGYQDAHRASDSDNNEYTRTTDAHSNSNQYAYADSDKYTVVHTANSHTNVYNDGNTDRSSPLNLHDSNTNGPADSDAYACGTNSHANLYGYSGNGDTNHDPDSYANGLLYRNIHHTNPDSDSHAAPSPNGYTDTNADRYTFSAAELEPVAQSCQFNPR